MRRSLLGAALPLLVLAAVSPLPAAAEQASEPSSAPAAQIDAGGSHTCAVRSGKVYCWGLGFSGQLGYGNTNNVGDDETPGAIGPVDLGSGRTATAVSAGDFHTCALLDDGSVRCWGFGADGRLGYGNTSDIGDDETPASAGPVPIGGPAIAISAGGSHTCAVLAGGAVRCWGFGLDGRLGYANLNPATLQSPSVGDNEAPASVSPVVLGGPATAISVGEEHSCALLAGGTVRCWGDSGQDASGDGGDGRLGYVNEGTPVGDNETPSGQALIAVACPSTTQCTAIDIVGQQVTFNPTAPGTPTPTTIDLDRTLTAIACPSTTQCTAVAGGGRQLTFDPTAPGTVTSTLIDDSNRLLTAVACPSTTQCTAVDSSGRQVTFNPTAPGTPTPTPVSGGNPLIAVACPSTTQCTAVGNIAQEVPSGQQVTFNPTAPGTPTPTTIDPSRSVTAVACPSTTQCTAVDRTGQQVTFNPTAPGIPTPTGIDLNRVLTGVACPSATQCTAVDSAGQQVTFNPAAPGNPTTSAVDAEHWLNAVACPSATQCTAVGRSGQQVTFNPAAPGTPTPTTIDPMAPVDVGGTSTAISAGDLHTCAVLTGGNVRCWGRQNPGGRLGNATLERAIGDTETPGSRPPVDLGTARTATAITAGNHTCARLDNGTVRCWGPGESGRLGYGNTNDIGDGVTPESPGSVGPVDIGGTAAAVTAGGAHTCALLDGGAIRCWGKGQYGRLGYGNERDVGDDEVPAAAGPVDFNPGVSVADASVTEGNSGTRTLTFTVKLSRAIEQTATVAYATANATAQAPGDYTAQSGTLTFAPGETSKTVAVPVKGDTIDEPNERFLLNLSSPSNATVTRSGTGRILDDDAAPTSKPPPPGEDPLKAEAARLRGLRGCYASAARHARRELRQARRLRGARRTRARRHAKRHKASLQRACRRRYGRTPGRVTTLRASAASASSIVLSFKAVGTDGTKPPAARGYVVKQSRRPIRSARAFRRAQSLCGGTCRFSSVSAVGQELTLRVTDLRSGTRYYYAVAARDNVSRRVGPRSRALAARTR